MLGNKKSFTLFTIIQLAAFLLLANFGYGKSEFQNSPGSNFFKDKTEAFQAFIYADQDIHNPLDPSDIPEDLPGNEEEKEVEEREGGDGEFLLSSLRPFILEIVSGYKFSYSQKFALNQATIPLYVLFHCWKNFLV